MRIAPALLLAAILASPLGACDRTRIAAPRAEVSAPGALNHRSYAPLPTPPPGPLDLAEVFKIPPLRVQSGSTTWYIACTWDRVYFAPGSAEILPDTAACLRQMVHRLGNLFPTLVYAGTDSQEADTREARIDLVERRATNVVEFLRRYGVWVETVSAAVSLDGQVFRTPDMSVADYHQEYRVAVVPTTYP